jgi:alkylation response protein AidB-like acyl-CoA dehydrogenase
VRQWLADHLGPYADYLGVGGPADDIEWDVRVAWEKELASAKLLNITWPIEYGGRGGTARQEHVFMEEHFRARAPYWAGIHGRDLFGPTLLTFGSPDQKARFLPKITSVEEFWGQGFSEPDAGSDLASLRTRAELVGDEWVVNGQKIWMSLGSRADWLYVLCRTDPNRPRHTGLSLLMIPAHQEGVDIRPIRNMAGGCEFAEVFLTNARTEAGLVVGDVNQGWSIVMEALGNERAGSTVLPYQAKFDQEMVSLLGFITTTGTAPDGEMRQRIAQAWGELFLMRVSNQRMLSAQLAGQPLGAEASVSKLFWSHWHRRFGELAMDVRGMASQVVGPDYDLDALQLSFLNARAETIYGGTAQVQRNIVAERVLGLPREPR